jgi:flagellar motor switch protein FliN
MAASRFKFKQQKETLMSDMTDVPTAIGNRTDHNLDLLAGVSLRISVEVGSASIPLRDLLNLGEGSVVELDRAAGDLLDIFANGTLIAKGEIVTVEGRYGIRVVDVVAPDQRALGQERRV